MNPISTFLPVLLITMFLMSCATPIAPTGGPADNTAPIVEFTEPQTGTINFRGTEFRIQFNEYINRSSVPAAISIEPDLGVDYDLSWKRRTLIISFQDNLPDSTTVIVKLGGAISDVNGNRMDKTTSIAVSTGDEIDSGRIFGAVKQAETGFGARRQRILLYRTPFDFNQKANFEVTTDTSGAFTFSYLSEGNYQALLVDDRNRNKIWDRQTEQAFPFYEKELYLEKGGADTLQTIYVSETDSIAPSLLGVGLLSSHRLRFRFSEPVQVSEQSSLQILNSDLEIETAADPLYISPEDNFILLAQSREPLSEDEEYAVNITGITDLAGNALGSSDLTFSGSAQEDTTLQRITGTNVAEHFLQNTAFEVTYAAPITDPEIRDSLVVIEGTIDFSDWPAVETDLNRLMIHPQEEWVEDTEYQFLVWNPVTQRRKMFEPQIWDSTEYGDVEILIQNEDSAAVFIAELKSQNGETFYRNSFSNDVLIRNLPPISYTLTVFKDVNGNGKWDRGRVIPFEAPEPYYVQSRVQVQEGFTSQVEIAF